MQEQVQQQPEQKLKGNEERAKKGTDKSIQEYAKQQMKEAEKRREELKKLWDTLINFGYDLPRIFSEVVNPYFAMMRPYSDFLHEQIRTMAYCLSEMAGHHDALANDYWLAAQKYVASLAISAEVLSSSADRNFERHFRDLQEAVPFQNYFQRVAELAQVMSRNAGVAYTNSVSFWIAAERHILAIGARAIASAKNGSDAIEALRMAFSKFEAVSYLASIRESAYYIWKAPGGTPGHALDDWLKAEDQALAVEKR